MKIRTTWRCGHPRTEENQTGTTHPRCRECNNAREARYRAKRSADRPVKITKPRVVHSFIPQRGLGNHRSFERAYGPEDQAADVLRRYGPVYRCDERGRMDTKGKLWRFGMVICDGEELIARADRRVRAA